MLLQYHDSEDHLLIGNRMMWMDKYQLKAQVQAFNRNTE